MSYNGGKGGAGVYQTIINQIPPYQTLILPFAGHGGIGRRILPATQTFAIDKSLAALAAWGPIADSGDGIRRHLICGCGLQFLERYPYQGNELVYADPPYMLATRSTPRRYYQHELWDTSNLTDRQQQDVAAHSYLLGILTRLPCRVALSGYASPLYESKLSGWRLITFSAATRRGTATECLWTNYPEPTVLHDYRYLGRNYRERERITRKGKRWEAKFRKLPILERRAILSRLLQADAPGNTAGASDGAGSIATNSDGGSSSHRHP